jgi:hypothetical protein
MSATVIQGEGIGMRESLDERPASEGVPYGAPTGEAGGELRRLTAYAADAP